jgi:hypothetical protein
MTEQEQQAALRAELVSGIMSTLTPGVPVAPAPLAADATPAQIAAHEVSTRDHAVFTTLSKSTGDISPAERAELLAQVRDCLAKGW